MDSVPSGSRYFISHIGPAGGDRLPKGQRVHSVPMAPQVRELLLRLAPADLDLDGRVFPGEKGGAMDGSALHRRYVKALQRAGVRRLRFHDYADLFVMPTSMRRSCSERFRAGGGRHNQSASRKAMSVSGGR